MAKKTKVESKPVVIRRRPVAAREKSPEIAKSFEQPTLSRWQTGLETGDLVRVNGPCTIMVRRIHQHSNGKAIADLIFVLDKSVTVSKISQHEHFKTEDETINGRY